MENAIAAIAPFLKTAPALDVILPLASSLTLSSLWTVPAKSNHEISRSSDLRLELESATCVTSSSLSHGSFEKWGLLACVVVVALASAPVLLAARTSSGQRDEPPKHPNNDTNDNSARKDRDLDDEAEKDGQPSEGAPPPPPPDSSNGVADEKRPMWSFLRVFLLVFVLIGMIVGRFIRWFTRNRAPKRNTSVIHPTTDLIASPAFELVLPFSSAHFSAKSDFSNATKALVSALFIYGIIDFSSEKEERQHKTSPTWQTDFPAMVSTSEQIKDENITSVDDSVASLEDEEGTEKNGQTEEMVIGNKPEEVDGVNSDHEKDGRIELETLDSASEEESLESELDEISDASYEHIEELVPVNYDDGATTGQDAQVNAVVPTETTTDFDVQDNQLEFSGAQDYVGASPVFSVEGFWEQQQIDESSDDTFDEAEAVLAHEETEGDESPTTDISCDESCSDTEAPEELEEELQDPKATMHENDASSPNTPPTDITSETSSPKPLSRRQLAKLRVLQFEERLQAESEPTLTRETSRRSASPSLEISHSRLPLQPLSSNHPLGILSRRIERASQRTPSPVSPDLKVSAPKDVVDVSDPRDSEDSETQNVPEVPVTRAQAWGRVAGLLERKLQHD